MNKQQSVSSTNITQFLKSGPVAIIRDEDGVDLSPTLTHLRKIGFANIVVMGLKAPVEPDVLFMEIEPSAETFELINSLIVPLSGRWIYYAHNAEYLYFPFCEGRSISDVAQFVEEERRESVFSTTVDLYPSQIDRNELILHSEDAHFDEEGYFSRDRFDGADKLERQIDVFGGLKWRYAEHIEWTRQRIDRIAFFKAKAGLREALPRMASRREKPRKVLPDHETRPPNKPISQASRPLRDQRHCRFPQMPQTHQHP